MNIHSGNQLTKLLLLFAMLTAATVARAQVSFDSGEGCLNVIDASYAQGIGEYGDGGFSANYLHEIFIGEQFTIGAGVGYNYHKKYKFSAIPVYLSTHYFFLDRRFSPFVNLRIGGFALFNAKHVGTNEKYSISKEKQGFSLFVSPSIGVKMNITPTIGIMAAISDEAYLTKAFDTSKNDYKNRLLQDFAITIGLCFQIKGW